MSLILPTESTETNGCNGFLDTFSTTSFISWKSRSESPDAFSLWLFHVMRLISFKDLRWGYRLPKRSCWKIMCHIDIWPTYNSFSWNIRKYTLAEIIVIENLNLLMIKQPLQVRRSRRFSCPEGNTTLGPFLPATFLLASAISSNIHSCLPQYVFLLLKNEPATQEEKSLLQKWMALFSPMDYGILMRAPPI